MYIEYKPGAKHASIGADVSDSLDSFRDAGYILNDSDLVVDIDVLSKEQIQRIIKEFNIKTQIVWTDRGVHLYFKRPNNWRRVKGCCTLGFEVEFKHKNNTESITIKRNGIGRVVENKGIREDLPDIFNVARSYRVLLGYGEGDGRNNVLFEHRKQIDKLPHWRKIINFINNVVFDEPLPNVEMETITREINITADKNNENEIADLIMSEKNVVKFGERLFFYDGERYTDDLDKLNRMVYSYCKGTKTHYVNEVINQMIKRTKLIDKEAVFPVKFRNGILKDGAFIELDYKDFTPYFIDIEYDPEAERVTIVDDYLNHLCSDEPEYVARIQEILGHCLITDKEFKRLVGKFFIFVGDGGNGKGTLLAIIRSILNSKNCSALSMENMTDERYLSSLVGKMVNLGDDIEDSAINKKQMKILKNISTCDSMETRKLFENSTSVEPTTTLIFTSNHILKSFEKGFSYQRRVDWLPMYSKPKKKDPKFISKITTKEALKYWVRLIVEGYLRLYEFGQFTESPIVSAFNKKYHDENNTALEYVRDLDINLVIGKRSPEVYEEYEEWCENNGLTVQSKKLFNETLRTHRNVTLVQKKVNGKNNRVYVEGADDSITLSGD